MKNNDLLYSEERIILWIVFNRYKILIVFLVEEINLIMKSRTSLVN